MLLSPEEVAKRDLRTARGFILVPGILVFVVAVVQLRSSWTAWPIGAGVCSIYVLLWSAAGTPHRLVRALYGAIVADALLVAIGVVRAPPQSLDDLTHVALGAALLILPIVTGLKPARRAAAQPLPFASADQATTPPTTGAP